MLSKKLTWKYPEHIPVIRHVLPHNFAIITLCSNILNLSNRGFEYVCPNTSLIIQKSGNLNTLAHFGIDFPESGACKKISLTKSVFHLIFQMIWACEDMPWSSLMSFVLSPNFMRMDTGKSQIQLRVKDDTNVFDGTWVFKCTKYPNGIVKNIIPVYCPWRWAAWRKFWDLCLDTFCQIPFVNILLKPSLICME